MKTKGKGLTPLSIFALFFVSVAILPHVCGQTKWVDKSWAYRKLVRVPNKGGPYRIWLFTGKRARPRGQDIRVTDRDGKGVPHTILHSEQNVRHLVVFGKKSSGEKEKKEKTTLYSVYFGNRSARTAGKYNFRAGLTLETRALPKAATFGTWKQASQTLREGTKVYGKDFWHHFNDAYNPFGPQSNYIIIYDGYINCPKSGEYHFVAISQDPSYLHVDGQLISQWPPKKKNPYARKGQHGAPIRLDSGPHHIRYVAFISGHAKPCALYWVLPGTEKQPVVEGGPMGYRYRRLSPKHIIPVPAATEAICQSIKNPVCADFRARPVSYLESGGARMVAVKFTSQSSLRRGTVKSYKWDFGDGITANKTNITHVYLTLDTYEVKFNVLSNIARSDTFELSLPVEPIRNDLYFSLKKKDNFWKWTKDYDPKNMHTDDLLAFQKFLRDIEKRNKIFDVCQELDRRRTDLTPVQIHEVAMDLGKGYQRQEKWDLAKKYFDLALNKAPEQDLERQFDALYHLAELYFSGFRNLGKAERTFKELRHKYPATGPRRRRMALIRLGDIQRNRGKLDEAQKLYREAEMDTSFSTDIQSNIAEGHYVHEVEAFLNQGKADRALKTLDEWLWHRPSKRLDGYPVQLKLKALMVEGKYEKAARRGHTYLSYAVDPDFIPRIHVLSGECYMENGELDRAEKHFKAVLRNWKESPAVQDAANGLARIKKLRD
ncbi:MAG: tetratricopeptide repeat protein [Planctomycetes bacterium]|nr:tetratricopeptide repeat protein [Planctomycetota bacterium]